MQGFSQEASKVSADPSGLQAADSWRSWRILVVDDNQDAADTMAELLALNGQQVRTAYRGAEALALVPTFRPEIVFLDLGLPGMDGYEVARRLRAQPEHARMTLIALTGYGRESDFARSKEAGIDYHLVKPVDLTDLQPFLGGRKKHE